jgi:prepilin-type N-terminal cleavage/methylation domain-containing protein
MQNTEYKIYSAQNNGFTLMEVMAAIFIILIGLVGIMSLISRSLYAGTLSTSRLIAANLAQEGIEVVKNIRDLNYLANGWDDWYASVPSGTITRSVQYNSPDFDLQSGSYLNFDSTSGLYSYDTTGTYIASPFKREIILTKDPLSPNEIKVVSQVTWTERGVARSIVVEDRLWNWR